MPSTVLQFLPRQATLVPSILKQGKQYFKKQTLLLPALDEKFDPLDEKWLLT